MHRFIEKRVYCGGGFGEIFEHVDGNVLQEQGHRVNFQEDDGRIETKLLIIFELYLRLINS